MKKNLTATTVLIAINGLIFLFSTLMSADRFGLFLPEHPQFRPWQFLTSMFLHGSMGHLLMNMFGLFMFGSVLERMWGAKRFVLFYLLTGLGAGAIYCGVTTWEISRGMENLIAEGFERAALEQGLSVPNARSALITMTQGVSRQLSESTVQSLADLYIQYNAPVVGASGAIYGILTAFGILFPNAKLALIFFPVPVAAKYFIPGLLLLDLFSGVTGFSIFGGGIAHFAHLGGALIGFLLMLYWRPLASRRPQNLQGFTA